MNNIAYDILHEKNHAIVNQITQIPNFKMVTVNNINCRPKELGFVFNHHSIPIVYLLICITIYI